MPISTQCLYFHLGMHTDDDGFVNSPKTIQRTVGASDDDIKLLIAKHFVITFESGVMVVKHHLINNNIRNDRYKPSQYEDEKAQLYIKRNKAYTLNGNQDGAVPALPVKCSNSNGSNVGIPNDNQWYTNGIPNLTQPNLTKHNSTQPNQSIADRLTEDETRRLRERYGNYDDLIKKVDGMIAVNNTEVRKPYSYISKIADNENWPSVIEANAKKAKREAALKAREEADRRLVEEAQKKAEALKHDQKI